MTKTDMAWVLSFGFFSIGTSESRRNENICFADGAISKILQGGREPVPIRMRTAYQRSATVSATH